ncbi:cupredoxin domain-containing protein [Nitrosopumilus sp.]|uniref:cupredoxin domain-containing protein n=1 Tax=Nitrosopumilus sp. TaxID=2024843 RepID=UPI0029316EA6|nr:plastocyanin/azurin family copper-binding protein [Nitrosopumilus sp.]
MAGIDKAAIAFSIAIVAIGVGFAFYMEGVQSSSSGFSSTVTSPPMVSETTEEAVEEVAETTEEAVEEVAETTEEAVEEVAETTEEAVEEVAETTEEAVEEVAETTEEVTEAVSGPQEHAVDMPAGTSVPGCEENNECYTPADITISVGDTVAWVNVDTAAHTVTSGSPADGPSGVFDSSLVMADATYAFTFEEAGSYDYFCMVHPWMVGSVTVN